MNEFEKELMNEFDKRKKEIERVRKGKKVKFWKKKEMKVKERSICGK